MESKIQKFVVVGVPRSGSTFLINRLAQLGDTCLPEVNQYELFNPYERLFNCHSLRLDGATEATILDGFFSQANRRFAGIKTIPGFHREWDQLAARADIQFITLIRRDFLSCLASYIVSDRLFRWTLPTRQQLNGELLSFRELYPTEERLTSSLGATLEYLLFNYRSVESLNSRETTICLETDELLTATLPQTRLEQFFRQTVNLEGFQAPTHYSECFADHFFFKVTVSRLLNTLLAFTTQIPEPVRALMGEGTSV